MSHQIPVVVFVRLGHSALGTTETSGNSGHLDTSVTGCDWALAAVDALWTQNLGWPLLLPGPTASANAPAAISVDL